ncbi:hypothetical protein CKAN_02028800 [Cinnamomum micranthum f. kanehirae]|uniref:DUF659 domain-containing protein n=1 Tax=Cinnamomum micranthum f. kanehirae TaxID=337451 RepID=A0A443PK40_9MAGN|nr:hypothetical protein CKAN_02028800 [Cinnamomum micranthum f. kanehirae]
MFPINASTINDARKVTRFIYNHTHVLYMMRKYYTDKRDLIRPAIARFGTNFITLKMGRAISKFFHYNWILPNVTTSPYYRAMVDTIAKVGPRVKPTSAYEISGKYLDMEYDYHTKYLEDHFKTWKEYGGMLMCDGWTGNNRRHIINFMAYCVTGTIFISLIDDTSHTIDGWDEYIVAVVTNNVDNFKAAGKK